MGGCHLVKALITSDGSGHSLLNEVGGSSVLLDADVLPFESGRFLGASGGGSLLARTS